MKRIITSLIIASAALAAHAQSAPSLIIPVDPASSAVANTSVARKADAFAVENNAAQMSLSSRKFAVAGSFTNWAPQTSSNKIGALGAWFKAGNKLAVGLSGKYLIGSKYTVTDATGSSADTFSPKDMVIGAAVSYSFAGCLSAAITAKVLSSTIAQGVSSTAFGADLSLAFDKGPVNAGLAICNLGSSLNYGGNSIALPSLVKAGAAYSIVGITASVEADYIFQGGFMAGAGLEYSLKDILFVRAGYHYGDKAKAIPSFASAGLGLKFAGVEINASYMLASEALANTLMVGLGYSF